MLLVHFLIDTPVVAFLLLLGLLVTVVPIASVLLSRRKPKHPVSTPGKEPPTTRFLGIQMDIILLIFGLLLLFGVIAWLKKAFFG